MTILYRSSNYMITMKVEHNFNWILENEAVDKFTHKNKANTPFQTKISFNWKRKKVLKMRPCFYNSSPKMCISLIELSMFQKNM